MGAMEIIKRIESREKIIDAQTDENKIKMIMVKLDIEDSLTINNEILEFDIYNKSMCYSDIKENIIGMDFEILFPTENACYQLNKICHTLNRLPFVEAHYDSNPIEVAIEDEEDWVGVVLYCVIDADYIFTEYDLEWFDIENQYINRNTSYSNHYQIMNQI